MKKVLFAASTALFLLAACNNNKKPGITVTSEDGKTTTTIDPTSIKETSDAFTKKADELKKLTPYTLDQLKALLPEQLEGVKRSKFSANSTMGAAFAEAEYEINDSTEVQLNIFDCAGEAGAGIYAMQYLGMMNMQSESDDEYTKTIDFNGSRAIEHGETDNSKHSITYFAADRLMVTIEGKNTGIDMLKKIASNLKTK
jgi:hypothetical protein